MMMDETRETTGRVTSLKGSEAWRLMTGETAGDCEMLSEGKSGRSGVVGEVDECANVCK